jgi:hypothetical protein
MNWELDNLGGGLGAWRCALQIRNNDWNAHVKKTARY